jgi:glucan biosynthesis protein
VWVTPHGTWGKGTIELNQLPTNNTNTDNVVLLWHPAQEPKAGDHLDISYTLDFYMNDAARPPLAFCKSTFINDPAPPPVSPPPSVSPGSPPTLAMAALVPVPAASTKPGKTKARAGVKTAMVVSVPPPVVVAPVKKLPPFDTTPVQFLVDFGGAGIEGIPASSPPDLDLDYGPPGTVMRDSKVEKNGYDNSWRVTFTIEPWKHNVPTELRCRLTAHGTVSRRQAELDQLQARLAAAQLANDAGEVDNLQKNLLPKKEQELNDAKSRPLSETWIYTWHQ